MDTNIEMLNYIHTNAEMGVSSISRLLEIVEEESDFKTMLLSQYKEYKEISDKTKSILKSFNKDAKEITPLKKMESYIMINLKTLNNKTPDNISGMLMQGSVMGIIQIIRSMKRCKGSLDKEVYSLAERLLKTEQNNIEECKKFIGEEN